jgi:Na+/proline symporter
MTTAKTSTVTVLQPLQPYFSKSKCSPGLVAALTASAMAKAVASSSRSGHVTMTSWVDDILAKKKNEKKAPV